MLTRIDLQDQDQDSNLQDQDQGSKKLPQDCLVNSISQTPVKNISPNVVTDVYGFIDMHIRFWAQRVKGQGRSRQ